MSRLACATKDITESERHIPWMTLWCASTLQTRAKFFCSRFGTILVLFASSSSNSFVFFSFRCRCISCHVVCKYTLIVYERCGPVYCVVECLLRIYSTKWRWWWWRRWRWCAAKKTINQMHANATSRMQQNHQIVIVVDVVVSCCLHSQNARPCARRERLGAGRTWGMPGEGSAMNSLAWTCNAFSDCVLCVPDRRFFFFYGSTFSNGKKWCLFFFRLISSPSMHVYQEFGGLFGWKQHFR